MKIAFLILTLLLINESKAQTYIVGDTGGFFTYYPELTFQDDTVELDINCDKVVDIKLQSDAWPQDYYDWPTLNVGLPTGGEVMMMGRVSIFDTGDTININEETWMNYAFIFGVGEAGAYGWGSIENKYIGFRMPNGIDTSYLFLKISTNGTLMTIHQIISVCSYNPILHITSITSLENDNCRPYPMPFQNNLSFNCDDLVQSIFYNLQGQIVLNTNFSYSISTSSLTSGTYILKLLDKYSNSKSFIVLKE